MSILFINLYRLIDVSSLLHKLVCTFSVFRFSLSKVKNIVKLLDRVMVGLHSSLSKKVCKFYRRFFRDIVDRIPRGFIHSLLNWEIFRYVRAVDDVLRELSKFSTVLVADPHSYDFLRCCFPNVNVVYGLDIVKKFLDFRSIKHVPSGGKRVVVFHPCHVRNSDLSNRVIDFVEDLLACMGFYVVHNVFIMESASCCGSTLWFMEPELYARVATRCIRRVLEQNVDMLITYCPFCYVNLRHVLPEVVSVRKLEVVDIHELLVKWSPCGGR